MKLILPNDEQVILDEKVSIEEKQLVVKTILEEWQDYFIKSWNHNKTKICLEILSNYLVYSREEDKKHKEDKFVLSQKKVHKMKFGDKKVTTFSNLTQEQSALLGLIDNMDE